MIEPSSAAAVAFSGSEGTFQFDLANDPLTFAALTRLRAEVQRSSSSRDRFRSVVEAIPDSGDKSVRRGIGYWVLGRSADAIETLKGSRATAAEFVRAQAPLALGQTDAAMDLFERLRGDDTFGAAARVGTLACLAANADFEALAKAVKALPKAIAESADGVYFQGRLLENDSDHEGAIAKYDRALELDASHRHALFRLA